MKPFVIIFLDRLYHLRLTFGVILEYEQYTGKMLCELADRDAKGTITLLWLMMRRESPELTLEQMAKLLLKEKNAAFFHAAAWDAAASAFDKSAAKSKEYKSKYFDITNYIKTASEMGISIENFLGLTPAEFNLLSKAHIKRRKIERNDRVTQAWFTARFVRWRGSMPELSGFLVDAESEPAPMREMTDAQMQNACKLWCVSMGGKILEG